jgi:hypothetical protein
MCLPRPEIITGASGWPAYLKAITGSISIFAYTPGYEAGHESEVYDMVSMFVAGCIFIGISIFIRKMATMD